MSRTVTIDGQSYSLPTGKDRNWLADFNALMLALIDKVNEQQSTVEDLQSELAAFQAAGAFGSVLHFMANTIPNNTTPRFLTPWYMNEPFASTERVLLVPVAGTISNLQARHNALATDVNTTFTVRTNGVDTALLCTIPAASQAAEDNSNSFAVAAGDRIGVKIVNSGATVTFATSSYASMLFTPAAEGA